MKTALIITLGTRDITIKRDILEEKFGPEAIRPLYQESQGRHQFLARPGGAFLLENFDRFKGKIEFPILKPALDWLYRKHQQIDSIILVATDQQAPHIAEKFRNGDTLHYAAILQRLIPARYKGKDQTNFDIRISLLEEDVVYLDAMYSRLSGLLRVKPYTVLSSCDRIYLLNQGGIDAINTALLLNGLNVYGKKLHLLSVNEHTNSCNPLQFPGQYLREQTNAQLHNYLQTYNYAAIKQLEVQDDILALAGYAEHRLNFDFEQAVFSISHLTDKKYKDQLILEVREVAADEFELLREVYGNAVIKFRQEAYVDFLFRVFRLVEGLAKYYACRFLGGMELNIRTWERDINRLLEMPANEGLRSFLQEYSLDDKGRNKLDLSRTPTIPVWIAILEYFDKNTAGFLKKVRVLADLRNQSIGAHNFNPVSLQHISETLVAENMDQEFLFSKLDELFRPRDTFDRINGRIRELGGQGPD